MKITVLAENTALSSEYIAEHGLSLYIETESKKILFDMGQTDAFAKNAEALGIDLEKVDFAVLSHGHYDHGGGLGKFLAINKKAKVYINENAFGDYYSTKYIGLDKTLENNERICFVADYLKIDENIELFSCNDVELKYLPQPYGLTAVYDGEKRDDDFRHEQYMLIKEREKRVLVSGCSHKGILNLTEHFKPNIVIGGFHFMKLDAEGEGKAVLDSAAEALNDSNVMFYTCHCTGEAQYAYLRSKMEHLQYIACGESVYIT